MTIDNVSAKIRKQQTFNIFYLFFSFFVETANYFAGNLNNETIFFKFNINKGIVVYFKFILKIYVGMNEFAKLFNVILEKV